MSIFYCGSHLPDGQRRNLRRCYRSTTHAPSLGCACGQPYSIRRRSRFCLGRPTVMADRAQAGGALRTAPFATKIGP
jgi:hypothetical protein